MNTAIHATPKRAITKKNITLGLLNQSKALRASPVFGSIPTLEHIVFHFSLTENVPFLSLNGSSSLIIDANLYNQKLKSLLNEGDMSISFTASNF